MERFSSETKKGEVLFEVRSFLWFYRKYMLHIVPSYDDSPPDILKSNTVTCFKIISGLLNNLQNHRQLPVCRNKQFERVTGRLFKISKCFHGSKPKLYLFFSITRQQKNFQTISAYKESNDLQKIIHLMTQSL